MKNNIIKILLGVVLIFSIGVAKESKNSMIYIVSIDNKDAKLTPSSISNMFAKSGYEIADNRDMNTPFLRQFQKKYYKSYNLFTLMHKDLSNKLVKLDPINGIFFPLSMGIWESNSKIYISFLSAKAMIAITNSKISAKLYKKLESSHFKVFKKLGATKVAISYAPLVAKGELVTKFTLEDLDEDLDEIKEGVEMGIEADLKPKGFVMANFTDYSEEMSDEYDFYQTYSICKLKVIYAVHQSRPEAGAFAPCSLVMYKKKSSSTIEFAYPSVYNWLSVLHINDKKSIDELLLAQEGMNEILSDATE